MTSRCIRCALALALFMEIFSFFQRGQRFVHIGSSYFLMNNVQSSLYMIQPHHMEVSRANESWLWPTYSDGGGFFFFLHLTLQQYMQDCRYKQNRLFFSSKQRKQKDKFSSFPRLIVTNSIAGNSFFEINQ